MPHTSTAAARQSRKISAKLAALKEGKELPVDPYAMAHGEVGQVPDTDECAVLKLAIAYHDAEEPDAAATSWEHQVKAPAFFNAHGLSKTLTEILRVGGPEALD